MNNKFSKQQTKLKVRKRTEKKGFTIGLWKKEIKWEEDEIERTHFNETIALEPSATCGLQHWYNGINMWKLKISKYQDGTYTK